MKRFSTSLIATAALVLSLTAQDRVDIGLHQTDKGNIEVRVRPQTDFSGIFSSVVFTLRWDRTSGASLGDPVQEGAALQYIPLAPSGAVREEGNMNYQVYAGFGFSSLSTAGTQWQAGQEYVIATIPVQGGATVELLNDSWTAEQSNNGDYYVSLGGQDRTGLIYKGVAASGGLEGSVTISPNPNEGLFSFSFYIENASDVRVEVLNTLGQSVFNDVLQNFSGSYTKEMDLTAMSNGIYYLKITQGGVNSVHKIVYR